MIRYSALLTILLLLGGSSMQAQLSPYYSFQDVYKDGLELYEKSQYGAAQKLFDRFVLAEERKRTEEQNDLYVNARFYQAMSAYHLERENTEALMVQFMTAFPTNTKANLLRYYQARYYFDRKKYSQALDPLLISYTFTGTSLGKERYDELEFMLGYSYYLLNKNDKALPYFTSSGSRPNAYQEDSRYYRALILYKDQDFEEAYTSLKELTSSQKYGQETQIYLANTLLKLKRMDELYVLADKLAANRPRNQDPQVYFIVANASYEREDYPRAAQYFRQFEENRGKLNRTGNFRYAYSLYQQGKYEDAIPMFQRSLSKSDTLGQTASYYLGFCYLEIKDESSSKFAFKKAADAIGDVNSSITEDALYQYAKVAFSTQDYDESLRALRRLEANYPSAEYASEVRSLIGEILLYSKNYPEAISYLESVPRTNRRSREAYQTACYYYALQLYEDEQFGNSNVYFQKAIENDIDRDVALSARYWMAESRFRQGNYDQARAGFTSYQRQSSARSNEYFADSHFGLGWCYFKEKQYTSARSGFDQYISLRNRQSNPQLLVDAHLRAGDCMFLQRKYPAAIEYYDKVTKVRYGQQDYAYYQIAESNYRQGRYSSSVNIFDQMVNNFRDSKYRDDALDRMSEIYATWIKDNNQAAKYAKILVQDYPRSPLAANGYNRLALVSYNLGNEQAAINYFKKVLSDYTFDKKNSQIALDNLSSLLPAGEFDRVLADYRSKNPKVDEGVADLSFNLGVDRYYSGNYSSAITQFSNYINDFKNGPNYFEALLYRARSYKSTGNANRALGDYQRVYSGTVKNSFTHVALFEAAEMKFEQKQYMGALELYQQLESTAENLENRNLGIFGVAKSYKTMSNYQEAQRALEKIANNPEVNETSRVQAQVEIGHCLYLLRDLAGAMEAFANIERDYKNAFGAESQYMITRILYDLGRYAETKEAGIYMKSEYPTFNYWKANAFLFVAEANYKLGETFQAKGVLESLITEAAFPDIQEAASKRLKEIEAEEQQNESSIILEDDGKRPDGNE